jgi:uncharacterized protein YbjT (DUF2867 family)
MILVTGGTGFVGHHVVHALRSEERPVRVLVRDPSSERARTLANWGCELAQGDVTDSESLRPAVEGCDRVMHFVALIAEPRREPFERIMKQGTHDLVAAAKEMGVRRFVLMSALGTDERSKDVAPYYDAKWDMEQTVEGSGVEYVIFRPSFIFGKEGGILPMFMRQVRLAPVTPVAGDGERRLQPIWVEDVARFFAGAVENEAAAGRTFDLGGPDQITWNEFLTRLRRVIGVRRRPMVHVPMGIMRAGAAVVERLPRPLVTRDQLTMLAHSDNVGDARPANQTFGIEPIGVEEQLRRAAE